MNKIIDCLTLTKKQNLVIKRILEDLFILMILLLCCVDWDRTLDNLLK